jgi:hypothetical protein
LWGKSPLPISYGAVTRHPSLAGRLLKNRVFSCGKGFISIYYFRIIFITPSFRAETRVESVQSALALIIKILRAKAHSSTPVGYSALKDGVIRIIVLWNVCNVLLLR